MMTESPSKEAIAKMESAQIAQIAATFMAADVHMPVSPERVLELEALLDAGMEAIGWTREFMLFAQRMAYGVVGINSLQGMKDGDGFTDEDRAAFKPFIFSAAYQGPDRRDPETGAIVPTFAYPDIGRGKTELEAVVRGVVFLACGQGAWHLRRNGYPSSDCWVQWQATRWAMDGMIIIRHDHIPDVRLDWMDVAKVAISDLEAMIEGERVGATLKDLTEHFAVFQMENGEVFVGPATLACEWRAFTWKVILGADKKRVAEVLDRDGDALAYLMPVHEELVAGDRARHASEYTSPGGSRWSRAKKEDADGDADGDGEPAMWKTAVEGAFVYHQSDGWWTPDSGPFGDPYAAMNAMDPGEVRP